MSLLASDAARAGTLPEPDAAMGAAARERQSQLTKPPGSLGRLEDLAVQVAAWQRTRHPKARPAVALLFASDHPVTRHGVSPYPSEVTRAMLENFATGGAAASVLGRQHGVPLWVADVGVNGGESLAEGGSQATVHRYPVAADAAGDIRVEDAMSVRTFTRCMDAGRDAVKRLGEPRVVLLGEMGIGNTTPAAAVCAALLGGDPAQFVGAGTGTAGSALEHKRQVVREAVERTCGETEPREILRRVGGRELAALFGAMRAALEMRAAVVIDGFIVTAAALAVHRLWPAAAGGLIFAHRSAEQGHRQALAHMAAHPLLDLGLRLGEGSGALVAFPLIEAACALHSDMATFESAGVPGRKPQGGPP